MIKPFEFYFDFISPYSYLAHKEILKIENKFQIKIKYRPILLGAIHKLLGIKAAIFIPSKAKFMIKDCKLWADKNKTDFKFNNYFPINSINLMRGAIVAEKDNFERLYIDKFYNAFWKDGLNLNDETVVEQILKNLNLNPKIFLSEMDSPEIKTELKKRTDDAHSKGIFGVPSFIINKKLFWGQDRLEFVLQEALK